MRLGLLMECGVTRSFGPDGEPIQSLFSVRVAQDEVFVSIWRTRGRRILQSPREKRKQGGVHQCVRSPIG